MSCGTIFQKMRERKGQKNIVKKIMAKKKK